MQQLRIFSVDFSVFDHLIIKFSEFSDTEEKSEYNGIVHQLFIDIRKAYDSVVKGIFCMYSLNLVFP
jgi:hypothetical protein